MYKLYEVIIIAACAYLLGLLTSVVVDIVVPCIIEIYQTRQRDRIARESHTKTS